MWATYGTSVCKQWHCSLLFLFVCFCFFPLQDFMIRFRHPSTQTTSPGWSPVFNSTPALRSSISLTQCSSWTPCGHCRGNNLPTRRRSDRSCLVGATPWPRNSAPINTRSGRDEEVREKMEEGRGNRGSYGFALGLVVVCVWFFVCLFLFLFVVFPLSLHMKDLENPDDRNRFPSPKYVQTTPLRCRCASGKIRKIHLRGFKD